MCINLQYVYNRYVGKRFYTSCGYCDACKQEKAAHRATRIRNNYKDGEIPLFVTLTYDRLSCPVVLRKDLENRVDDLPVYRLAHTRNVRQTSRYDIGRSRIYEKRQIDCLHDVVYPDSFNASELPQLKRLDKKYVGITYYEDGKRFIKRLRSYLDYITKRYNKTHTDAYRVPPKFSFYMCSEYGETTYRPHFHLLLFIPSDKETLFRKAILSCWSYADRKRTADYIQVARDAASYVASYVNSGADFPRLFETRTFRQKHSYSHNFGMSVRAFQLSSILEQIKRRTLEYHSSTTKDGVLQVSSCLIPSYVLNRYFPKPKGYSRRTGNSLYRCLRFPDDVVYEFPDQNGLLAFDAVQSHSWSVRIRHAFEYYHRVTGKSFADYYIDYQNVWNLHFSCLMKKFYEESSSNRFEDAYDNIRDYYLGGVRSYNLDEYGFTCSELDPNKFTYHINKTARLEETYHLKKKSRKVVNRVMAFNGHYV